MSVDNALRCEVQGGIAPRGSRILEALPDGNPVGPHSREGLDRLRMRLGMACCRVSAGAGSDYVTFAADHLGHGPVPLEPKQLVWKTAELVHPECRHRLSSATYLATRHQ